MREGGWYLQSKCNLLAEFLPAREGRAWGVGVKGGAISPYSIKVFK